MAAFRLNLAVGAIGKLLSPLFFVLKGPMKITNLSAILIVRDGFLFRSKAISKKLERPIAAIEMAMGGKKLPKTFLEQALADLEYLNFMAGAHKKEGI